MNKYFDEYNRKKIDPHQLVKLIQPGSCFEYGFGGGFPPTVDEILAEKIDKFESVSMRMGWSLYETKLVGKDPTQEHLMVNSFFVSPSMRKHVRNGLCSAIPRGFGDAGKMYREYLKDRVDVAFVTVAPMDKHGYFNFGIACSQNKALCDVARTVVVEVNEAQPWACGGYDEIIHISEVDYILESKYNTLPVTGPIKPNEQQAAMASFISEHLEDGITLQLGIGAMPNMICESIMKKGLKDVGIHSELFTEGMMHLMEEGIINGRTKSINKGKCAYTFANGSKELYEYIHHNNALATFPVEYINDVGVIGQNMKMFSVNSALKIDLTGQVSSESVGPYQISGSGGQLDFHRGAYQSPGGKAFLAVPSYYTDKEGNKHSSIIPYYTQGDAITDPRNEVTNVVTEFGLVNLKGRSIWERTRLLISIAHPDFRDYLTQEAMKLKYLTNWTAKARIRS